MAKSKEFITIGTDVNRRTYLPRVEALRERLDLSSRSAVVKHALDEMLRRHGIPTPANTPVAKPSAEPVTDAAEASNVVPIANAQASDLVLTRFEIDGAGGSRTFEAANDSSPLDDIEAA